ncbi:hypothetical protein AAF712_015611 [Marasmius tenuissimus]|uniref:G domain-containing protein n=1 Tax=Marasmius tenuissimus TaxID=585030 RepID=A0ABR2ZA12_9AGAR
MLWRLLELLLNKSANSSSNFERPKGLRVMIIGGGRSEFVKHASGAEEQNELGKPNLEALETQPFEIQGHGKVILVDTPGFDDLDNISVASLHAIGNYVIKLHESCRPLDAVVFLHSITEETRLVGIPELLTKFLGQRFLPSVSIVTTNWEELAPDYGAKREEKLIEFYSEHLKGAQVIQHQQQLTATTCPEIMQKIIRQLKLGRPRPLRIQIELVNQRRSLNATGAGLEFIRRMTESIRHVESRIRKIPAGTFHNPGESNKDAIERQSVERQRQDLEARVTRLWEELKSFLHSGDSSITNVPQGSWIRWFKNLVGIRTTNALA